MNESQTMTLPDGRALGYAEYGDPGGKPVFYFHGFPASRLQARVIDDTASERKMRIVSVDRPGIGLSDFQPKRRIVDWHKDISALADHSGIDRFYVAGASGGGPYSAVCARALPDRVIAAVILAGVGPLNAPNSTEGMSTQNKVLFRASSWIPAVGDAFMVMLKTQLRNRARLMKQISQSSAPEDKRVLDEQPEIADALYESLLEAFRQGTRGPKRELYLYTRKWGFRLDRIEVPVFLWQGEKDANVPPSMGRYQAAQIPDCRATFMPEEGHIGAIANHMDEVFDVVLS